MRCTQYIGLTAAARAFLDRIKAEKVKDIIIDEGMFGEGVSGYVWKATVNDTQITITETVDVVPWSSGPMIFTCLNILEGEHDIGKHYQWNIDPTCDNEYDRELGVFYV